MSAPDNREAEECGFAMSLATSNSPAVLCNLPKYHEGLHCHHFGWQAQPTSGDTAKQRDAVIKRLLGKYDATDADDYSAKQFAADLWDAAIAFSAEKRQEIHAEAQRRAYAQAKDGQIVRPAKIDTQFSEIANDPEYKREAVELAGATALPGAQQIDDLVTRIIGEFPQDVICPTRPTVKLIVERALASLSGEGSK